MLVSYSVNDNKDMKEANIRNNGDERRRATVMLACMADGKKLALVHNIKNGGY